MDFILKNMSYYLEEQEMELIIFLINVIIKDQLLLLLRMKKEISLEDMHQFLGKKEKMKKMIQIHFYLILKILLIFHL